MNWLISVALNKAIKRVVQLIVAFILAHNFDKFGINIDPVKLTPALYGGIEILRNWAKVKLNIKWL